MSETEETQVKGDSLPKFAGRRVLGWNHVCSVIWAFRWLQMATAFVCFKYCHGWAVVPAQVGLHERVRLTRCTTGRLSTSGTTEDQFEIIIVTSLVPREIFCARKAANQARATPALVSEFWGFRAYVSSTNFLQVTKPCTFDTLSLYWGYSFV